MDRIRQLQYLSQIFPQFSTHAFERGPSIRPHLSSLARVPLGSSGCMRKWVEKPLRGFERG